MKVSRLFVLVTLMGELFIGCHRPGEPTHRPLDTPPKETNASERDAHADLRASAPARQDLSPAPAPIDRSKCGLPPDIREPDWPHVLDPVTETEPEPSQGGTISLAVLPDTQYYASCGELHFPQQTKWLAAEVERRNIVAAIQLGDLTEHNTPEEWDYVQRALAPLTAKVPVFLATGNHDYGLRGVADKRNTLFHEYFGTPAPKTASTVAEVMKEGTIENAYYRVPLRGVTLGVLVLEWSPTNEAVEWAKKAVAAYPYDRKIFITHAYLYHDGSRYDFLKKGTDQLWNPLTYGTAKKDPEKPYSKTNAAPTGAYDGEMLWNQLLVDMPGLFLTINGHVLGDGTGVLASKGQRGELVHQMLTNFQMLDEGGLGYLRLIEIAADGSRMQMKTYSPSLDRFATAENQHFSLPIEPPLF